MKDDNRLDLIWRYLEGGDLFKWEFLPMITWGFGIFVLIVCGCSIYIYLRKKTIANDIFTKYRAMIFTTLISLVGPISWLIIFPAHASSHDFIDFIIWYLPYTLLGFIIVGISLKVVAQNIKSLIGK